jgi:hypothetical protein
MLLVSKIHSGRRVICSLEKGTQMKYSTLIKATLASSAMLFAGTSIAMGPGGPGGCGEGCGQGQADCGGGGGDCSIGIIDSPVIELNAESSATLLQMREEEKLAHDVYLAMSQKWDAPVFNIRNSEIRHMGAMKKMLDRFGMQDTITDDTPGVFVSEEFTDLYAKLVESGSESLMDAFKVGAKIEELDLSDLQIAVDGVADPVLLKVYANLQRATRNHLRAFAAQIELNGGSYTAEHLPQEQFDAIATSDFERGNIAQGQGMGKGKAQGQGMGNGQGKGKGQGTGKGCGLCDS